MQCPICSVSVDAGTFLQRHAVYRLLECPACHVQYWWPMKHPGKDWYEQSDIYGGRTFGANKRRIYWNHSQFLHEPLVRGDLIDIGCGIGALLAAAQERGYRISGIDFDPEAVEQARAATGCYHIYATSLEAFLAQSPQQFDVVTAFEVLEHLDDPKGFLLSVKQLLKPGGHVAVSVPNRRRWKLVVNLAGVDLPPHHLTRWDVESLRGLLERCGFEPVTIRQQEMDMQSVLSCLFWMLPYRIVWHRLGKRMSQSRSYAQAGAKRMALLRQVRSGLIGAVRGIYVVHRVVLVPVAAAIAALLRIRKVQGMGLYACARLKETDL